MPGILVANIIGQPNCGKSELCKHYANKYGCDIVWPSKIIEAFATKQGVKLGSRDDYSTQGALMLAEDPDAFVRPCVSSSQGRVLIDGLRIPSNVDRLRVAEGVGKLIIVSMYCPLEERFRRELANPKQRRFGDKPTVESFLANEVGEYFNANRDEVSVCTVMNEADYEIDASSPNREDVIREADPIFTEFFA